MPLAELCARGWVVSLQHRDPAGVQCAGRHPRGALVCYGIGPTVEAAAERALEDADRVEAQADVAHRAECWKRGVSP